MINCSNCEKPLKREVFCNTNCRVNHFRKKKTGTLVTKRNESVTNSNNIRIFGTNRIRKPLVACEKHGGSYNCGCN